MQQHLKQLMMTLALLVTAATGAWADELSELFTTNTQASVYTGEHFKITPQDEGNSNGFKLYDDASVTIEALNGETITKVEFSAAKHIDRFHSEVGTVSYSSTVATVSGVNASTLTVDATNTLNVEYVKVYYTAASSGPALYLDIDGTTATLKYGDDYAGKLYFDDGAWKQGGSYASESTYNFLTTLSVDASCQNFTGTILSSLFCEWHALTTINGLGNLNTEMVTDMSCTFQECYALTTVDLSGWNTANVKEMFKMFKGSSKLETIYVGDGWSTAAVTDGDDMFYNCTSLPGYDRNKADVSMAKLTDDGGYLKKKPIELTWDPVTKTATLDEMPEGNVVVDVEYYSRTGVTLNVTGETQGGSARLLKKLDDGSFADMTDEDKVREDNKFILMVNKEDGYDFKVPDATFEEFTEDEYVAYYNWAKDNDINVPLTSALLWVTMPHVDSGNLNLEVNFQQMLTYTLLYQPASGQNPDVVACKMERSVKGTPEVSYMAMRRGASMGDGTAVWTTTMQAAYAPTKVAFVPVAPGTTEADLTTALNSAALTGATISQSADA